MVAAPKLVLVQDYREIAASHRAFVQDAPRYKTLAVDLVRRTQYWIYEPTTKTFSPSKFSGYVTMDFRRYGAARSDGSSGVKFDSGVTQRAITDVLGDYQPDDELARALEPWAASLFDADVLEDIEPAKWRFVRLPIAGVGGLAALAGGWEGSDELVEAVLELRRTPGRAIPEID